MSQRPSFANALDGDEDLLWQGAPMAGRPMSRRAIVKALLFCVLTLGLLVLASVIELYRGPHPIWRYVTLGTITAAALCTFWALQVSVLDWRRARAADARTAYAISNQRALVRVGPYTTDLALAADTIGRLSDGGLDIAGPDGTKLRFDRLADAETVLDTFNTAKSALP